MKNNLKIMDIRKLDTKVINNLCCRTELQNNCEKIDIIREFNSAPRFSVFLKSLFFNIKTTKSKTNYLKCFLKSGGMGRAAVIKNNEIAGIVLYGDYCLFPSIKQYDSYPPDFESAFLGFAYIDQNFSGYGLEERLLLSVEKDLIDKKYKSIETIGKRANDDIDDNDFEKINFFTVKFLISKGFYIKKNNELYPLLRLELKNIVTFSEEESWFYRFVIRRQGKRSSVTETGIKTKR